ncbi:hypothetical protein [Aquabacterium sp.]|uniref:hypothetical protein n=1 Tax=Aquabacterium sp. TaxID=1872578 RepID=UPI0027BA8D3D|nr:hypothetical protein [Aquabacterium sp.]
MPNTYTPKDPEASPETSLAEVVALGLQRLIVPRSMGGHGAPVAELSRELSTLAQRNAAAAWLAWSQCMAVEALVHSSNVALRDYVLPDLLDGSRAGAISWRADFGLTGEQSVVQASALERGWHLQGRLDEVPNLQWDGYVVVCPVWFQREGAQPGRLAWVLLRSEEDGLRHELDRHRQLSRQAACGTLHLQQVYFREDELLADDARDLTLRLRLLDQALRPALWMGALQHPIASPVPQKV